MSWYGYSPRSPKSERDPLADVDHVQPSQRNNFQDETELQVSASIGGQKSGHLFSVTALQGAENERFMLQLATAKYPERPLSCGSHAPQIGDLIQPPSP